MEWVVKREDIVYEEAMNGKCLMILRGQNCARIWMIDFTERNENGKLRLRQTVVDEKDQDLLDYIDNELEGKKLVEILYKILEWFCGVTSSDKYGYAGQISLFDIVVKRDDPDFFIIDVESHYAFG